MNYSERSHPSTGACRAWHGLILLLLGPLILNDARGLPSLRLLVQKETVPAQHTSLPYLSAVGPAPLRFAPPVPEPVAPAAAVSTTPAPPTDASDKITAVEALATPDLDADTVPEAKPAPETLPKDPPRILLDDVRPAVRPEEFLPYFQIPGRKQAGELTVVVPVPPSVPAPSTLPPSSATYTQTPK